MFKMLPTRTVLFCKLVLSSTKLIELQYCRTVSIHSIAALILFEFTSSLANDIKKGVSIKGETDPSPKTQDASDGGAVSGARKKKKKRKKDKAGDTAGESAKEEVSQFIR